MSKTVPELTSLGAAANADELLIYDASETGTVKLKRITIPNAMASAPVQSVNGQTGVITLTAADVNALPSTGGTIAGDLEIADASPILTFNDTDAAVNKKIWYAFANADQFSIRPRNDDGSAQSDGLLLQRDGIIAFNAQTVWHAGNFDPASKSDVTHTHGLATTSTDGFMDSVDKTKLNSINAVTGRADFCNPSSDNYLTPQRLYTGLGISQSINVSGSRTLNLQQHRCWLYKLSGDVTIDLSNMVDGQFGHIVLTQDATGNHVVSWSSKFHFPGNDGAISADPYGTTIVSYYVVNASTNFVACAILRGLN